MLVPAILYKKEIQTKMLEYNYTEDMMYYTGYLGNSLPSIEETMMVVFINMLLSIVTEIALN